MKRTDGCANGWMDNRDVWVHGCMTCLREVDASLVDEVFHAHSWDKQEARHVRPPPARRLLQSSVDHRTQAAPHVLNINLLPARPNRWPIRRSVFGSVGYFRSGPSGNTVNLYTP